jgi:hypothetical protein
MFGKDFRVIGDPLLKCLPALNANFEETLLFVLLRYRSRDALNSHIVWGCSSHNEKC